MKNLDIILKSRDITLPTKVCLVKAMVFPVVMYGCESWTKRKAECQRIDAFELGGWRRLLRVPWTARRSNQSILKEISPDCSLEGLMVKLKLQYWATGCKKLTHLKRSWCWERWKAGGKGDDREWDGWMASPTQWTWVWENSRSWWWTGKPGMLQSMGSQSWTWLSVWTELNWSWIKVEWAYKEQLLGGRGRRGLRRCRHMFVFPGCLLLIDSKIPVRWLSAFSPIGHVGSHDDYIYVSADWATVCPRIWLNIILNCVLRVFLDDVNIWIIGWVKWIALPIEGGPHLTIWGFARSKKTDLTLNKREFLLPDSPLAGTLLFPAFTLKLTHWLSWVTSYVQSIHLAGLRTCQPMMAWASSIKYISSSLYICASYWFCVSGELWLIQWYQGLRRESALLFSHHKSVPFCICIYFAIKKCFNF